VVLDKGFAQEEPEARPILASRKEGFENPAPVRNGNPWAVINDLDFDPFFRS
jgi:hypothetical protein